MDINVITQLIANLGFPIAVCIYLAYSNEKLKACIDENSKAIASLEKLITIYFNIGESNE